VTIPAADGTPAKDVAEKVRQEHFSRRSTPMNADKPILFNPRLSVFIGGQPCFGFFQQPPNLPQAGLRRPRTGAPWFA